MATLFLADNIDQLDLALDQLAVRDRNFDRFALILVDNVAEITLHAHARDKAGENDLWSRLGKPKYPPQEVQDALGPHFQSKVRFANATELISDAHAASILNLHSFRNTAYHQGQRHEGILHSLALFYFLNVCELLENFSPRWWSWSTRDQIPHRARKYLGSSGWHLGNHKKIFAAAFSRLKEVAASLQCNLTNDLHADMGKTIEMFDGALDFLAKNWQFGETRNRAVVYCQAWPFAFSDEGRSFAAENNLLNLKIGVLIRHFRPTAISCARPMNSGLRFWKRQLSSKMQSSPRSQQHVANDNRIG